MRPLVPALVALTLFAALPAPVLSETPGDVGVRVIHDLHPDGYAVVGNLAHFGFLVTNGEGLPGRHHDVALSLTQGGRLLFESTALHDYDGVGGFDWTFTRPGPFTVTVTVDDAVTATFHGTVVTPAERVDAALAMQAPGSVTAGAPATFQYMLVDAVTGGLLAHKDVLVRVTRVPGGEPVFATHTHTHEEQQAFTFAFPAPGEYDVTFTAFDAFPRPTRPAIEAFTATERVRVSPAPPTGDPSALTLPDPSKGTPRTGAVKDGHRLVLTHDPDAVVGPFTFMRASALVLDVANGTTLQHVDFEARVVDPFGNVVFESATLHEYDGVLEIGGTWTTPGTYALHVRAERGAWSTEDAVTWTVVPPSVGTDPGVFDVAITKGAAVDASGEPWNVTLSVRDEAGRPLKHSELDVTVTRGGDAVPLLTTKLHTHASGDFPFTFAFPHAGTFDVHVTGTPTTAAASVVTPTTLSLTAPGPRVTPEPVQDASVAAAEGAATVPPFPGILAVAALGMAFLAVAVLGKR